MLTCKSPRKVMLVAYRLAKTSLPTYSNEFSRHDFTLPQLFACLVLREHQEPPVETDHSVAASLAGYAAGAQ